MMETRSRKAAERKRKKDPGTMTKNAFRLLSPLANEPRDSPARLVIRDEDVRELRALLEAKKAAPVGDKKKSKLLTEEEGGLVFATYRSVMLLMFERALDEAEGVMEKLPGQERDTLGRALRTALKKSRTDHIDTAIEIVKDAVAPRTVAFGRLEGVKRLLDEVIHETNTGLVRAFRRRYTIGGHLKEADVEQHARIGLLKAAAKFDHTKDVPFANYAHYHIRAEIWQALNDGERTIRSPAYIIEDAQRLRRERDSLRRQKNGVEPTHEELAHATGASELAFDNMDAAEPLSLEDKVPGLEGENATRASFIGSEAPTPEKVVHSSMLSNRVRELLGTMRQEERDVLVRHHFDGETYASIGRALGMSRDRVRLKHDAALARFKALLRNRFGTDPVPDLF
jgi:RNA polymerase primary sigma factor